MGKKKRSIRIHREGRGIIVGLTFLIFAINVPIYLFMEESAFLMDSMYNEMKSEGIDGLDMRNEWAFEMFDDIDIITFLFSGFFIDDEEPYHFDNWSNRQFFIEN